MKDKLKLVTIESDLFKKQHTYEAMMNNYNTSFKMWSNKKITVTFDNIFFNNLSDLNIKLKFTHNAIFCCLYKEYDNKKIYYFNKNFISNYNDRHLPIAHVYFKRVNHQMVRFVKILPFDFYLKGVTNDHNYDYLINMVTSSFILALGKLIQKNKTFIDENSYNYSNYTSILSI